MARYVLMLLLLPLLKKALRLTTAVPTNGSPSAVAASTEAPIPPSWPSPTLPANWTGHVVQPSTSAAPKGVFQHYDGTAAPDVPQTWSTSASLPLLPYVPTPIRAPSRSPASHEHRWEYIATVFTTPGKSTPFRGCVCGAKKWGDQVLVPAASNTNWRKDTPG